MSLEEMEEHKRQAEAGINSLNEILEHYSHEIQQTREIEMLVAKNDKLKSTLQKVLKLHVSDERLRRTYRRESGIIQ